MLKKQYADEALMATSAKTAVKRFRTKGPDVQQVAAADQGPRFSELDGIRGIAVLVLLAYHALYIPMVAGSWSGIPRLVLLMARTGWLGVDLFFVLSGFLITGILLDTKHDRHYLRNFYARRALRIWPLYYVVLLLILVFYSNSGSYVLISSFYLANLVSLFGTLNIYGPLWSLSVEEHFYLIWPWVVRFTSKRALAITALAICLGEPLARALAFGHISILDIYSYSWFRFDGLAWGALLALFFRSAAGTRRNLWWLAGGSFLCGAALFVGGLPFGIISKENLAGTALLYTASQMMFVGLIAAALGGSGTRLVAPLNWRPLRLCGDVSYCFYLIHIMIFHAWDFILLCFGLHPEASLGKFGHILLRAFVGSVISFAVSLLSYRYFESPILRLKGYFAHSGPGSKPSRTEIRRPSVIEVYRPNPHAI